MAHTYQGIDNPGLANSATFHFDNDVDFSVLSFSLPSVISVAVYTSHGQLVVKHPGDILEISTVSATFQLSEDLDNYTYFIDWIKSNPLNGIIDVKTIDVMVYAGNSNVIIKNIKLIDAFPVSVSGLEYNNVGIDVLTFTVDFEVFNYNLY